MSSVLDSASSSVIRGLDGQPVSSPITRQRSDAQFAGRGRMMGIRGVGMRPSRVRAVVGAVIVLATVSACGSPQPQPSSVPVTGGPDDAYILSADDGGAVVRMPARTAIVGVAKSGRQVWSQADVGGMAVCANGCPSAILSGSIDALNSPLVSTPAVTGHDASVAGLPKAVQVWVPYVSNRRLMVITVGKDGTSQLSWSGGSGTIRLESPNFMWFGSPGGAGGILFTVEGDRTWARVVTDRASGPHVGARIAVDEDGGCVDNAGDAVLKVGGRVRLVDADGKPTGRDFGLDAPKLGACALTSKGVVIAATENVGATVRTTTRFFDGTGQKPPTVVTARESIPVVSPDGKSVLMATDRGVGRYGLDGSEIGQFPGFVQGVFTPTGKVVLARSDGELVWRS